MPERARPATLEDLKTLLGALHDQHADHLLIGGYALLAHGYARATVDIDLLVPSLEGSLRTKQSARERNAADRALIEAGLRR